MRGPAHWQGIIDGDDGKLTLILRWDPIINQNNTKLDV